MSLLLLLYIIDSSNKLLLLLHAVTTAGCCCLLCTTTPVLFSPKNRPNKYSSSTQDTTAEKYSDTQLIIPRWILHFYCLPVIPTAAASMTCCMQKVSLNGAFTRLIALKRKRRLYGTTAVSSWRTRERRSRQTHAVVHLVVRDSGQQTKSKTCLAYKIRLLVDPVEYCCSTGTAALLVLLSVCCVLWQADQLP